MKWNIPQIDDKDLEIFSQRFGVDGLTARLFLGRNMIDPPDLKYFFNDDLRLLHNPFLFSQMDLAVDRINLAIAEGEKLLVFGDRDSDGITATALMVQALRERGLEVFWEVPMGDDHYGLSTELIARYTEQDVSLLISVDCGTGNVQEIAIARELGMESIIVDHHNPGTELPDALAIINPKLESENYPFMGLSAVALVAKLLTALDFTESAFYNQTFCFLNLRPGNESIIVEAVHISNLVETARISETFVAGASELQLQRVVDFIRDHVILVYQKEYQTKLLGELFGAGVDIALSDIAPEIWKTFPALKGRSLLRMLQGSRLNRFSEKPMQEIDAGVQLLVSFLYAQNPEILKRLAARLDITALGLVADMMPLRDENRIMVRHGLKLLPDTPRKGLRELMSRLGLLGRPLTATAVSWRLTPAINATGRMGRPDLAVRLLLDEGDIPRVADEIIALNEERKKLGTEAWLAVLPAAEQSLARHEGMLTMVQHSSIHRGITGILAGRLSRHFNLPSFVLARIDGHWVGSVRSARNFHVTDFLSRFSDILDDYGGHDAAGGFHLPEDRIEVFCQRLSEQSAFIELDAEADKGIDVDIELDQSQLTEDLEGFQAAIEPLGMDFTEIRYLARGFRVENVQVVGREGEHLRLLLQHGRRKWPAVYWSAADRFRRDFDRNSLVDCVFTLERNYFAGNSNLQLQIIDLQPQEGRSK